MLTGTLAGPLTAGTPSAAGEGGGTAPATSAATAQHAPREHVVRGHGARGRSVSPDVKRRVSKEMLYRSDTAGRRTEDAIIHRSGAARSGHFATQNVRKKAHGGGNHAVRKPARPRVRVANTAPPSICVELPSLKMLLL